MHFVDLKYVQLVKSQLKNFKKVDSRLFNFSCPICGDSEKDERKSRGYLYTIKNSLLYKCHNCDASMSFSNFLKIVAPTLFKEYKLEIFDNKKEVPVIKIPKKTVAQFNIDLPTISSLPDDHFAKKYVVDRKLPEYAHSLLYYAENFSKFASRIAEKYKTSVAEPRIVIPFYNRAGTLVCVQGRALTNTKLRYITLKIDDQNLLVYGLERVDFGRPVCVVEGPLDSLFLNNCIAVAGSDLKRASESFSDLNDSTFIFDNEPRNIQICKKIKSLIEHNKRVVIWPKTIKEKDINDMYSSGVSRKELMQIIESNTFSGIRANLEFNTWKKC